MLINCKASCPPSLQPESRITDINMEQNAPGMAESLKSHVAPPPDWRSREATWATDLLMKRSMDSLSS